MSFNVYLVAEAERDVSEIYQYVAAHDSHEQALRLVEKIEATCNTLAEFPERGGIPVELERAAVYQYRQVHYKPYRVIYEIIDPDVFVLCVLDGRRDLNDLLERRLLRQ